MDTHSFPLKRATPHVVQFIAPVTSSWLGAPHSRKCLRRASYRTRQQTRFDSMWEEARGACLTWSEMGGWQVVDALIPANRDVRHHRLLGLSGGRPWCWLYQSVDGQFAARWENARLQVCTTTPAAAIAGLRRCATRYARTSVVTRCPTLPWRQWSPPARCPRPSQLTYQLFIDCVKARRGLWSQARNWPQRPAGTVTRLRRRTGPGATTGWTR